MRTVILVRAMSISMCDWGKWYWMEDMEKETSTSATEASVTDLREYHGFKNVSLRSTKSNSTEQETLNGLVVHPSSSIEWRPEVGLCSMRYDRYELRPIYRRGRQDFYEI